MLKKITLRGFRNYKDSEYQLVEQINLIVGHNASGKTNLLEGIYLLGVGDSFRAKKTEEMVGFGLEMGRVSGEVALKGADEVLVEVLVSGGVVMGKTVNKRKYLIDGAPKRRKDILGLMPVVLFRPEDVELVSGSPDFRRKFLDHLLMQVDKNYENSLSTYEQALRRRNKILDAIREGTANRYSLTYWDGLIIKHGQVVQDKRRELVDYINTLFGKSELFKRLKIDYDVSVISESRLTQYKDAEVAVGYTLVGPHKDDFAVKDEGRNLGVYGSRGEQRMAVLALKMGEIFFIEERSEKKVTLLLDDVFSELDDNHKQEVLRLMSGRQVVVTSADPSDEKMFVGAKIIELG